MTRAVSQARGFCPWCGQPLRLVQLHGSARCAICRVPVHPCCEGAALDQGEACGSYRPKPAELTDAPAREGGVRQEEQGGEADGCGGIPGAGPGSSGDPGG